MLFEFFSLKMVKEHMILQEFSGKLMWHGSAATEYLENLPLANTEENSRESDTRYLLPRDNIFTFGLQNGITDPVIFFCCKICRSFIKPHEFKHHMSLKHSKQENVSGSSSQSTNLQQSNGKSKKNSHKNKKKVVPPPAVPPPPLFPKIEYTDADVIQQPPEELLPPILQPIDMIKESIISRKIPLKKPNDTNATNNLPPILSTHVSDNDESSELTKLMEPEDKISSRLEKQNVKHKKFKKIRNSEKFNPDKHCGVLDSMNRPCMRAVTCANHTIFERRCVKGRSVHIDKLIVNYKACRVKSKLQRSIPISIAPKQSNMANEVKHGFQVIELLYESENQNCPRKTNKEFPLTTKKSFKVNLPQHNLTVPIYKLSDVPSTMSPTSFNLHPKPLAMPSFSLHRVGSSLLLQHAPRLERQRMDLQTIVNQNKQIKISNNTTKSISLLNMNHNKQSLLKNNIKNNSKYNSLKRTTLIEKSNTNDVKHMKVITADLNGFILNTSFSDNDVQSGNQDKTNF